MKLKSQDNEARILSKKYVLKKKYKKLKKDKETTLNANAFRVRNII